MQRWRLWLTYFSLSLFLLPVLWPLAHPGLPRSNDHLPHYFRAVQLEALVRAGEFLPRWAPDLVFGYGYPVFNFFPYLAHYTVILIHTFGLDFLTAYKLTCALTLLLSGWAAFAFGRAVLGERAGFITGLAYALSPYLLYDLHTRGSLPENLALAFMPLVLLNLRRRAEGHWPAGAWAALSLGACFLAHNGITLQAMPFIVAYAIFETLRQQPTNARHPMALIRPLLSAALPFSLAGLLVAFFALPALLESPYVQIERGTNNGGMLYTNFFLDVRALLSWPRLPVDPDLLNPPIAWSLPQVALVLAGLAWGRFFIRKHAPHRPTLVFSTLTVVFGAFLVHPASQWVWDNVYLLRLTLFPFRLLGPVSLFIAILAGALFSQLPAQSKLANLGLLAAAVALVINALPYASPVFEPAVAQPTLQEVAHFELPPDFIGTTTVGEYLPRTVSTLPAEASARRELAARTKFVAEDAQVEHTPRGINADEFQITTPQPTSFIYQQFYFPGWQVALNGQSLLPQVLEDGRMMVALPAGTHTLTFKFGDTPVRALSNLLSVLGVSLVSYWLWRGRPRLRTPSALPEQLPSNVLLITALALTIARPLVYDAGYTPLLQRGLMLEGLRGVPHPLNHSFADEVILLGWDSEPPAEAIENDAAFTLNLYFKANRPLGVAYGFDVKLVDAHGLAWNEPEMPRPQNWRFTPGTDFWPTEQYLMLSQLIRPVAGTPPGEYFVRVSVFAFYNLQTIGAVELGPLVIAQPSRRPCAPEFQFQPTLAAPGDEVFLTFCWPGGPTPQRLILQDAVGRDRLPEFNLSALPSFEWPPDSFVREQVRVRLPADLETGPYTWAVENAETPKPLGELNVVAPERSFTPPGVGKRLNADLGPATLWAAEAPPTMKPGDVLPITLIWRADELLAEPYSVFVHLVNAEGNLVAQSDGGPANWARPTTGWLPNEFISDVRQIQLPADLPASTYTLYAGLYQQSTGERLVTGVYEDGRVYLTVFKIP